MRSKFSIVILILLVCLPIYASRDINIISSDESGITFEYIPQYLDTSLVVINNKKYIDIDFVGSNFRDVEERVVPQIPSRFLSIGVPSEFGNTVQILASQYDVIEGEVIPNRMKQNLPSEVYTNPELVTFGEYGIMRNLRVQEIKISPVIVDQENKKIRLYKKIRVKLNFGPPKEEVYEITETYLRTAILNFEIARKWGTWSSDRSLKKTSAIRNSVLSTGTWYKFEAKEEGIYKIGRDQLSSLGIDPDNVDPRTIKLYNNGGMNLPERVEEDVPTDLVENAILVVGEEDGKFDNGDYILFYGRGTDFWEYDQTKREIIRRKHWYSKNNYYWITSGGNSGKRIENKSSENITPDVVQNTTQAFKWYDEDNFNIGKTGRLYLGEEFTPNNKSRTYINSLSNIVPNSTVRYSCQVGNITDRSILLDISENGKKIVTRTLYKYVPDGYSYDIFKQTEFSFSASSSTIIDSRSVLKFNFGLSATGEKGFIDYYDISYQSYTNAVSDELCFFANSKNEIIQYHLKNFTNSNINIFDVSNYADLKQIKNTQISGGEAKFTVVEDGSSLSKYIAVTANAYKTITNISEGLNSNVHGQTTGSKYIIITDKKFSEEAKQLADYRANESPYKMSTSVFYMDEIYNEFSCGMVDPMALRNFLKYAYYNWSEKPFYVLLLGDGNYDYLDREGFGTNYVPTYQTIRSNSETESYCTDDNFSLLTDGDSINDLAIGRVNVISNKDAQNYIKKIKKYETGTDRGLWNSEITFVADDGLKTKGNDGNMHTSQTERLVNRIPSYITGNKIYLAAYPELLTGSGRRKPLVNKAIIDAVNNGTLILNFVGHGNPKVWTHEVVFDQLTTIPQMKNDKLFFIVAATCDFGKYDDPNIISSTEEMLLKDEYGSIGTIASSRLSFSSNNAALVTALFTCLFQDSRYIPTIGEAWVATKKNRTSPNDRKYHLFGDPALRLKLPRKEIKIDRINGIELRETNSIQIKALSQVTINGSVRDNNDNVNTSFNGEGLLSVFDSEQSLYLEEINYNMMKPGGVIFRGRVKVDNGLFNASFSVPKDISYENKNGKVVAYLYNENSDVIGATNNIIVGGSDTTVTNDGKGPEVDIFFDNMEFENATFVKPDFTLFVKINDETGLNTTGTGVGHKLEAVFDDDELNAVDLTNSFVGDIDAGGKSGVVEHKFTSFEKGDHKIRVKAWDIFNNYSQAETFFSVSNSSGLDIDNIINYPNPFRGSTTFTFQHNLESALDVKIKVYSIAGRLIKEIEENGIFEKFVKIPWDGHDEDGNSIANGTYLYKVIIKSVDGKYSKSYLGKLAVFR